MGKRIEIVRRKREAECYNGENFDRQFFVKNCECTAKDFECDVGYFRNENNVCNPIDSYASISDVCDDELYIEMSTGYRKIPGNTCINGVSNELEPQKIMCSSGSSKILYVILIIIFAGGLFLSYKKYGDMLNFINCFFATERFDKKGFFNDFTKTPETMDEEMSDS